MYSELNPQIVKLYFGYTLQDGYEIKYYSDEKSQNEVTNNNQVPGTVYFTIKAVNNDINWYGETKKLKLKLI